MRLAECTSYEWACILISDEVTGWLAWVSSIVGFIAFAITLYQIFQIRSSTMKAEAALEKVTTHVDGTNLAYISSQLDSVKDYVRSNRHEAAGAVFSPMIRTIRLHGAARAMTEEETAELNRAIDRANTQISWAISSDPKYKQNLTIRYVEALLAIVTAWESDLVSKNRKEIRDENP
ncbi:hypothetical protein [Agrobacterium sp. OT33]|uniref:hypothetical protein n=1 Tax=Agrobacterium sp. OT33 TaxID=2815338 RepID=UPI001A907E82|nr:hypothetical protein [Agrobacterium sp. OT33]MBO0124404.1 hypothetical protein [Agrobacterium sp. OT33]